MRSPVSWQGWTNLLVVALLQRIHWLAENMDEVKPEPLTGDLAGLYKLRVGNYRVIYERVHDERTIVIHAIGHRREIYRKR